MHTHTHANAHTARNTHTYIHAYTYTGALTQSGILDMLAEEDSLMNSSDNHLLCMCVSVCVFRVSVFVAFCLVCSTLSVWLPHAFNAQHSACDHQVRLQSNNLHRVQPQPLLCHCTFEAHTHTHPHTQPRMKVETRILTHTRATNNEQVLKKPNAFVVKHYAGDVEYTVDGFLTKNKVHSHTQRGTRKCTRRQHTYLHIRTHNAGQSASAPLRHVGHQQMHAHPRPLHFQHADTGTHTDTNTHTQIHIHTYIHAQGVSLEYLMAAEKRKQEVRRCTCVNMCEHQHDHEMNINMNR